MVIEPERADRRDLVPVRRLPRAPRTFSSPRSLTYHGFRIVEVRRFAGPVDVRATQFGLDVLGSPPALLAP
jgi:hypothetical protein